MHLETLELLWSIMPKNLSRHWWRLDQIALIVWVTIWSYLLLWFFTPRLCFICSHRTTSCTVYGI
jgi:hypothetical protein